MVVSFRGTTGLAELDNSVHVFPNPVKAGACVHILMKGESNRPVQVEVVDALGSVIAVQTVNRMPASVTAPAVPGIYMLRVTEEGKGISLRKLVVE